MKTEAHASASGLCAKGTASVAAVRALTSLQDQTVFHTDAWNNEALKTIKVEINF